MGQMGQMVQKVVVVALCLTWCAVSSGAIFINRHIMVKLAFPYPITVAWMGLLTTTVASALSLPWVIPVSARQNMSMHAYLRGALPTGFCMALTFITGNLAYLYLTVSFIQMLKSLCPVITMVLLLVFRLEAPTSRLITSVLVISIGVAVASYGEMHASALGLASMLTSVVAESTRLVLTQHMLVGSSQLHPLEGLFFIGSACTACLTMPAILLEWGPLVRSGGLAIVSEHCYHFLAAACAGFGVNALAILVIKCASSLTLKVLGTAKDAALVGVGVLFLHESVTKLQMVGYSVSLAGFVSYNLIKAQPQPMLQGLPISINKQA